MKTKRFENRSSIPKKYKWDLDSILDGKSLQKHIDDYQKLFSRRIKAKDLKFENLEAFIEDLKTLEKLLIVTNKISNYISNNLNANLVSEEIKKVANEFDFLSKKLESEFGSEYNRLYKHKAKLKKWYLDPKLSFYRHSLDVLLESFKYKLHDEVEEYIVKSSHGTISLESIFTTITDSEVVFEPALDFKHKKHVLNTANKNELLKSNDSALRKDVYHKYLKGYLKHKESLALILFDHFKAITVEAKTRNYKNTISMLLSEDKVDEKLLELLFEKTQKAIKGSFVKYKQNLKKFYLAKFNSKMQPWDSQRELLKLKNKYSIEEAQKLALSSLKPFGKEYTEKIKEAFREKWIDYMPCKNKITGAYSIGASFGLDKKYILMNYNYSLDSVFTLVHELGHSMHSYYSDKKQNIFNASYPIILAEIASIYNELMLFDYLYENSKSKKEKFYLLQKFIDNFIGTVIKQTMWANYEFDLYSKIESGVAVNSFEYLSEIYYQNLVKYSMSKSKPKKDEKLNISSVTVPHFYYYFYVYKYAIGQLVGINFYLQYKKGKSSVIKNYIENFLSMGGSDFPLEILQKVGLNLYSEEFYKNGFDFIDSLIQKWIKLGNSIFKK